MAKFQYAIQLKNEPARELVRELVWDLLATCQRAASELDSVMEFGLSRTIQLASMSAISSRAGRRPARELLASWIVRDRPNSITLSSSLAARYAGR